jgi:hypothetical protein
MGAHLEAVVENMSWHKLKVLVDGQNDSTARRQRGDKELERHAGSGSHRRE